MADLANPGFALYRTPRNELFRSKAYEGHYLLYPAALFKQAKLGKKDSNGCLTDPRDRQQEIFFCPKVRVVLDVFGDLLLELLDLLIKISNMLSYGELDSFVSRIQTIQLLKCASQLTHPPYLTNACRFLIWAGRGVHGLRRHGEAKTSDKAGVNLIVFSTEQFTFGKSLYLKQD